jgi:LmbE family N-acetylglucosaminyl deacetylase
MNRILVISPHPDDESIGCGGTLRQRIVAGDSVHVVFLTSGENGGHGRPPADTARIREQEAREAARILQLTQIEFWNERDGSVQVTPPLIDRLRSRLSELQPDVIYVPHENEMHPDHRAAHALVHAALIAAPAATSAITVWGFEVWTPLQQIDDVVDITEFIELKLAAIRAHKSQCDVMRFDDAMLGLARYRGALHGWNGVRYAEIFMRVQP